MAKLCYKHHTNKLPCTYKDENMPNIEYQHDATRTYSLRSTINHDYKNDKKSDMTFIDSCIKIWNNLPTNLKITPYKIPTNITSIPFILDNTNNYTHFSEISKKYFQQNNNHEKTY